MLWPWTSSAAAARLSEARKQRFIKIAREAHERSREEIGKQKLRGRSWDRSGPMDTAGAEFERKNEL